MKGDFSAWRFDPAKHFTQVLKQQGRVDLDSDWNEQSSISQYLMRALVIDLLGAQGGPVNNCGFALADAAAAGLKAGAGDFVLGTGRYYVDGILVENSSPIYYSQQPSLPGNWKLDAGKIYIAYLDVWERHITWLEDDSIREVALGGPDTTTRVKTVWQVRTLEVGDGRPGVDDIEKLKKQIAEAETRIRELKAAYNEEQTPAKKAAITKKITAAEAQIAEWKKQIGAAEDGEGPTPDVNCAEVLQPLRDWTSGTMTARLPPAETADTPCVLPPDSRYRGLENHLYRIEIHRSGDTSDANRLPTFKWSRENGSIATRWLSTSGNDVRVASTRDLAAGQWLEFTGEADDLLANPGPLRRATKIDGDTVTVENAPALDTKMLLPKIRRWDQTANDKLTLDDGAIAIVPGTGDQGWMDIEDGIQVQFSAGPYRSGDYWFIPARVATGEIEWPRDGDSNGLPQPPRGIVHHYAPLFAVEATGKDPFVNLVKDCRCRFAPLPCVEDE
jgi:hypothetical protein